MGDRYRTAAMRELTHRQTIRDIFAREGFSAWHTGGNCMAWHRPLDARTYVLITDRDGSGLYERTTSKQWMVGLYAADVDDDNTITCRHGVRLDDALAAVHRWEYEPW